MLTPTACVFRRWALNVASWREQRQMPAAATRRCVPPDAATFPVESIQPASPCTGISFYRAALVWHDALNPFLNIPLVDHYAQPPDKQRCHHPWLPQNRERFSGERQCRCCGCSQSVADRVPAHQITHIVSPTINHGGQARPAKPCDYSMAGSLLWMHE